MAMSVIEAEKIEDCPIHIRGNPNNLGAVTPRGFLSVVSPTMPSIPKAQSGRLEFANWLTSPENPLPPRVLANRIWTWIYGEGLVPTPDNFGSTGEPPTNPELLDYLARRLIEEKWSLKAIVREIVLSRAYQSRNKTPRRLSAEELRDAMLAVSGRLEFTGPGPNFPASLTAEYGFKIEGNKRSIFLPAFRNTQPDIFEVFDAAPRSTVIGKRETSTVPTQALYFLNNPFVLEQARAAGRLQDLQQAYLSTLGRRAGEEEVATLTPRLSEPDFWPNLYQALFASIEFRYIN